MDAYQERVVEEKKDLDTKVEKLIAFLTSPKAALVSETDLTLLDKQAQYMQDYSRILGQRISRF